MKRLVLFLLVSLCLSACGGGGGGGGSVASVATPTPTGTAVNLTPFKNVFLGTSAGQQYNFPAIFGTDSQGRSWSGSFLVVADGAVLFEGQNVTRRRTFVTLQLAGGTPVSGMTTAYYQAADGSPYKSITSDGITYTPTTQVPIPASANVGDFGSFGTVSGSNGTTITTTWSLNAGVNGSSILAISSVTKTGATVTSTEVDSYYLDAGGIPTKTTMSVTVSGVTVNLSGSKM